MDENTYPLGYKHLIDVQVMRALTLNNCGWSHCVIAKELGCSHSTIQRVLKTYNYETFTECQQHLGRAWKTTENDNRHLAIMAKCNYEQSLQDITNLSGLEISRFTTARRLKEVNLVSRYKCQKPHLTAKHKPDRLEWAHTHINKTVEEWGKVIFSDECLMHVGVDTKKQRVIRPIGARYEERYCTPTFKSGRVSIMIWACFTLDRVGPILILEQGGVGAEEYEEILLDGLLPLLEDMLMPPENANTIEVTSATSFLFMHDNVPCHRAKNITQLLNEY